MTSRAAGEGGWRWSAAEGGALGCGDFDGGVGEELEVPLRVVGEVVMVTPAQQHEVPSPSSMCWDEPPSCWLVLGMSTTNWRSVVEAMRRLAPAVAAVFSLPDAPDGFEDQETGSADRLR
jgi:hypothetical protein